ncbi:MAG: DNA-3-methyladenine glycosylase I [Desulfuromonadales bacterium]|nr:DNA-3-methyladenine glycosylase I [Desulfuromonadales bacterium]
MKKRCQWAGEHPIMIDYHDMEWGEAVHEDRLLFEFLVLEGAQAGLSWSTVLKKRAHYKKVFDNFAIEKIARYDEKKRGELLSDPGIIRNRLKIEATISNAQACLALFDQGETLDSWLWRFVDGRPIQNSWLRPEAIPTQTSESEAMSRELKRRGFRFVGPTICYAFMQATGMVNDHTIDCFRHAELA